ncbi:MAG: hypothetical protein MN733_05545, partial [Nitrososphaera sp.]|nr:hypothetical protein [Nitrososphaera sp.]
IKARQYGLRIAVIAFVTLAVATSGLVSSLQTAAAASMVNLWAVPVNSCIDDGKLQILRLKFKLENVNPLEMVRITLDPGTPEEKILEFDGNGNILTSDPAFVSVDGSLKFKTDGYYFLLAHLKGKFKVAVDKTLLTVGEHDALAEIFTEGASSTPSDDAMFKLRECDDGEADIVADFYGAPNNIKQDKKYQTFFKESNDGTANAGPHEVKVYLSSDAILDAGDEVVGEKHVGALPAGNDRMVQIQIELPGDSDLGPMFLIAWTDADEEISESNESNNMEVEAINVIEWADIWPEGEAELAAADDDKKDKKDKGKDD